MRSVNHVTLIGQLLEVAPSNGSGCNFVVQTVESWMSKVKRETRVTDHNCTAFGPVAENVRRAQIKGWIYIEGSLRQDEVMCFVAIPLAEQIDLTLTTTADA